MAYSKNYKHDVFISFSHVDNRSDVPGDCGWVKHLRDVLRTRAVQKLGEDTLDIWMDYELAGNESVTPAIIEELNGSAVILIICSEGYLASEWCKRELTSFLSSTVTDWKAGTQTRLFVVNRDKIERNALPQALSDLIGYKFWKENGESSIPLGYPVPDPDQEEYWHAVDKLGSDIVRTLKCLGTRQEDGCDESGPIVHLAEVTEDLETLRQEMESFLKQSGVIVLPRTYYTRETPDKFQSQIDRDLEQAKLFIQLLSPISGRKLPGLPQGYPGLQYRRALARGIEIIQWVSPDVNLSSIQDAEYRKLLSGEAVIVEGIERFKERVKRRALASPVQPTYSNPRMIFVNTESSDRGIAHQVAKCITRRGFGFVISKEKSIRKDLKKRLQECHGAIIVCASAPGKWVERQQETIIKILSELNIPPPILVIYEQSHGGTEIVDFKPFPTIEFDADVDCGLLEPFFNEVSSYQR
jgi:hypothetical protein